MEPAAGGASASAIGDQEQTAICLREALAAYDPSSFYATITQIDCVEFAIEAGDLSEAGRIAADLTALAEGSALPELAAAAQTLRNLLEVRGGQLNIRTRYRIGGVLAQCRINLGYLKLAETMLVKQRDVCSAPLDRRRISRQLAQLYTVWNKPAEAARCRDLMNSEFLLDPDLNEMRSRLAGKDAPRASRDMRGLVSRLQHLNQLEKALALAEQVLQHHEEFLGTMHPDTLESRIQLAFLCKLQRQLESAETLFKQSREEAEIVYGGEHPQTLNIANQMAVVWRHQGRYEEAERLCREVLEARQSVLGDRLDTADSLQDMAEVYLRMGRYDEAESYYQQRIKMLTRLFGEDDSRIEPAERRIEHIRDQRSLPLSDAASARRLIAKSPVVHKLAMN